MARNYPFEELQRFLDQMQHRLEDVDQYWDTQSGGDVDRYWSEDGEPTLDLVEYDDEYAVTVDLPGFEKDDVDVRIDDRQLVVEAERAERSGERDEAGQYIRRERRETASVQTVTFPQDVDASGVEARMQNGVLTVTVPKARERREGRRVDIE